MTTKLITSTLNGKKIAYSSETKFYIQIGKGSKGSYKTKTIISGNLGQALLIYNMINLKDGFKKRIRWSGSDATLVKETS